MRFLLLFLAVLQTAILAPTQQLASRCQAHIHGASTREHATGDHQRGGQHAPEPAGDCTHCPPADCARHQACAQVAVAIVTRITSSQTRLADSSMHHAAPPALSSADPDPPRQPPRLIA